MVSVAGNTLLALSRAVSGELGSFKVFTTTSAGADATHAVSLAMRDSEAPTEKYGGWYLNTASASLLGERRVKRGGFNGTTGDFTVARPFEATPQTGAELELRGVMPHTDEDGLVGVRTCINRAIRKLWTVFRFPITSTGAAVVSYDLGSLFWASRSRFLRLLDPDPGANGHSIPSGTGWDVTQNADTWTLELGSGFASGDIFYLEAEVPLNYRLYLSAAWANQSSPTAGLTLDADACLGSFNDVFQCALYECMKQLAVQAGGNRKAYWTGRAAEQRAVVAAIKLYLLDEVETSLGEGPSAGSTGTDYSDKGLFSGGWY
jgi:hypothetical protein